MIVICLEGCHGSGKTQLCRNLHQEGFDVLDEAFIDMPEYALHPQSLVMETEWVSRWFQRILQCHHQLKQSNDTTVYIADRSPYSACFYAKQNGEYLRPLIAAQIEELKTVGIFIYSVVIEVDREILWSRIAERLEREPNRVQYNEGSRQWMETTCHFYESNAWDFSIDNSALSIAELAAQLVATLESKLDSFKETSPKKAKRYIDSCTYRYQQHEGITVSA